MNRSQKIIRTSIIGIAANVLLAAFKAAASTISRKSIASQPMWCPTFPSTTKPPFPLS